MDITYQAPVVVVSGVSGSGKTEVARKIAASLGFQLLSLDAIKELIADAMDGEGERWLSQLDRAALNIMVQLARTSKGVVLDAYWRPSFRSAAKGLERVAEILCTCPEAVLRSRLKQRRNARHRIHRDAFDPLFVEEIINDLAEFQPLAIGSVLKIDTSVALDLVGVCRWIGNELSLNRPLPR